MAGIYLEQTPFIEDAALQEWLTRMMITISAELEKGSDLEPQGYLPDKIQDGMIRYFNQSILPDITSEGVWVVVAGTWTKMS